MKRSLIIRIPEPCHEQWSQMTVTAKGRTCARCERELIDFTSWSNRQLTDYLATHDGKICGKFAPHQLDKNLVRPAASYAGLSLPALAVLAATLTVHPADAQIESAPKVVAAIARQDSLENEQMTPVTISGTVRELWNGEPLYEVTVELKHGGSVVQRTFTDPEGQFLFTIHPETLYDSIHLRMLDYNDTIVPYTLDTAAAQPTFFLEPAWTDLGIIGMVYVSKKQLRKNRRAWRREERQNDD